MEIRNATYRVFLCKESRKLYMIHSGDSDMIEYESSPGKYEELKAGRKNACQQFVDEWEQENFDGE